MLNQVVNQLDRTFAALADPTRRAILARLAAGESTVSELAAPFDMTLPAVSKHVTVLERAGLVSRRRDGRRHLISLLPHRLADARAWIDSYAGFWNVQLDSLGTYLEQEDPRVDSP